MVDDVDPSTGVVARRDRSIDEPDADTGVRGVGRGGGCGERAAGREQKPGRQRDQDEHLPHGWILKEPVARVGSEPGRVHENMRDALQQIVGTGLPA